MPVDSSGTQSSNGSETVRPAGKSARNKRTPAKKQAAPATAGSAGLTHVSARLSGRGAAGLRAADSCDILESSVLPAEAQGDVQLQLTGADVQGALDTGRVDKAAAALDAMQEEAAQAASQSKWMAKYLKSVKASLPSCYGEAGGEAELLCGRVRAWELAQEGIKDSLAWAVGKTRAHLDAVRRLWEGNLQSFLNAFLGREESELQVLPAEACALVKGIAQGFGSMARCYEAMQMRFAILLQSEKALRQCMAATAYTFIRLVRSKSEQHATACCVHTLLLPWQHARQCVMHPLECVLRHHIPEQAITPTAHLEPLSAVGQTKSSAAGDRAAADSCVLPTAQRMPAVEPSDGAEGSVSRAASSRSQTQGQTAQGPPASASKVGGTGEGGSSKARPAKGKTGAEAPAALRSELLRQWVASMYANEPWQAEARSAAQARREDMAAAAQARVDAARARNYPLPRRVPPRAGAMHCSRRGAWGGTRRAQRREAGGGRSLQPSSRRRRAEQQQPRGPMHADACEDGAAPVADERPTAANSDHEAVLSLLLPGLSIGAVAMRTAGTAGASHAASAAPAVLAAYAALPRLDSSAAAESAQVLRQGKDASATPEEQRVRLRAFVFEQFWSADVDGAVDAPWPEPPSCELMVMDCSLSGLAERLYRRMGSTPAAAALLGSLVCPITKVCTTW